MSKLIPMSAPDISDQDVQIVAEVVVYADSFRPEEENFEG